MIITNFSININRLSSYSRKNIQNIYNRHVSSIDFSSFNCPHCNHCCWKFHARYERSFYHGSFLYKMMISRVICHHCHRTHSILPDFLVPYSLYSSADIIEALSNNVISSIDDSLLSYWSNKTNHSSFISLFLLCVLSKRSHVCIFLFSHDFFVFSSVFSYTYNMNNEMRCINK